MNNIQLIIAYKGTAYAGWQQQPGQKTVEGELKQAIFKTTGEKVVLYGAGRTDTGVHALGQSANFFTESSIPEERFALALNTKLPRDIRVLQSKIVSKAFHSRYSAIEKTYFYQIDLSCIQSPFYYDTRWYIGYPVDVNKIIRGSKYFEGTKDFKGFMASGSTVKDTVRTVYEVRAEQRENLLTITYRGNGFLYNMVRIITGTLCAVGRGQIALEDLPSIITSGQRERAGETAPPGGLFLEKVLYP